MNKKFAKKSKKALGQNFLKSRDALSKIISAGELMKEDTVLEIGPGKGILTEELLKYAGKVTAVEKDRELFAYLSEKFRGEIKKEKLILVNDDILNLEASSLVPSAYKIIANIPYNITGAILKKFLTEEDQPERMVLLVQKEVAERIIARDEKESILSISVKSYGTPNIVGKVSARYFSPAPKVDSAIIVIGDISRQFFKENGLKEKKFWEIVRKGFAHKRKKLSGNLKNSVPALVLAELSDKRAENLSLEDWARLAKWDLDS
ncbi:MAG: 16S rRNA (adenine(1518)-N(6)/adenine(1519)-N(6))-dimethyltransferase RsmA [Patescibacteria group bacterium]